MDLLGIWQRLVVRDRHDLYLLFALPLASFTAGTLFASTFTHASNRSSIYPSPRKSLQLLSKQDTNNLPYPSDILPGPRDIDTPYGSIRVYEWGPEQGRKVLFVHGISTPCIAFARLAKRLADDGCRVMLFDLFGRGYSDSPDPMIYRQDMGLWASQIFLVLGSSKLAWTGSSRFTLVGYSMGGGVAASFTSYFPELVESLILIAPGGLMRPSRISRSSKWLYGDFLPQFVVDYFVRRRLEDTEAARLVRDIRVSQTAAVGPGEAAASEVPDPGHPANAKNSEAAPFPDRPQMSVAMTVNWQLDAHPGFLPSFISSIKHAPITGEHERWRLIGQRCEAGRRSREPSKTAGLDQNKVLILLGAQDSVVVAGETEEDVTKALGGENVKLLQLEGGHDVPIVNSEGCANALMEFWDGRME